MRTKKYTSPARLAEQTDIELVSEARMLVAALSQLHIELQSRGIEAYLPQYEGGEIRAEYTRVQRQSL